MTGSFGSAAQPAVHRESLDVRRGMATIREARDDARCLNAEQAAASKLDGTLRQRVYRIYRSRDGTLLSGSLELPNADMFVGAWRETSRFETITPADLVARPGCVVELRADGRGRFEGSTRERDRRSRLRGAPWARSRVVVSEAGIES
jgi:hypothetical protein